MAYPIGRYHGRHSGAPVHAEGGFVGFRNPTVETAVYEQLPHDDFIRIHKSYIISIKCMEYIEGNLVKIAKESLPIGQNYKDELLRRLHL